MSEPLTPEEREAARGHWESFADLIVGGDGEDCSCDHAVDGIRLLDERDALARRAQDAEAELEAERLKPLLDFEKLAEAWKQRALEAEAERDRLRAELTATRLAVRDIDDAALVSLSAELAALRAELERERMRLAACGVAARGGSVDGILPEYRSDSLDAVTALRAETEPLRKFRETFKTAQCAMCFQLCEGGAAFLCRPCGDRVGAGLEAADEMVRLREHAAETATAVALETAVLARVDAEDEQDKTCSWDPRAASVDRRVTEAIRAESDALAASLAARDKRASKAAHEGGG